MRGVTGGDVPAKIWHDFAAEAERVIAARNTEAATPAKAKTAPKPAAVASRDPGVSEVDRAVRPSTGVAPDPLSPDARSPDALASAPPDAANTITGEASVATTADFDVDGHAITLQGVEPLDGRPARALGRYLRRHEVNCAPAAAGAYRCTVDGTDLATTILANGGSPAKADAPADLLAAQQGAQERRRGIWRHRR